jgi:hypothetical protein
MHYCLKQAAMKRAIEKAVAQFLLRTTDSEHVVSKHGSSNRHGATFHGGSEADEYSLEMNHISDELHHQLSSSVNVDAAVAKVVP